MKSFLKLLILCAFVIFQGCGELDELYSNALKEVSKGNYEEAIKIYNEILALEKDDPFYLNNLGWTLFRNDNFEEAKDALEKAKSKCDSKNLMETIEANLFIVDTFQDGKMLLQSGNYDEAMEKFEIVISKYNTYEVGIKYSALYYEGKGMLDEAKEEWEKIIDIYKDTDVRNKFYLLAEEKLSIKN